MADWPWVLRLTLLGEFVRVPEPLVSKVWLKEGLSLVWRRSLFEKLGVSLACIGVIRSAGFPLRQELRLHAHLVRSRLASACRHWRSRIRAQFGASKDTNRP